MTTQRGLCGTLGAALAVSLLLGGMAQAQERAMPTINTRVKALETKTDYYTKVNKKIHIARRSGSALVNGRATSKQVTCRFGRILRITFDPQLQFGGVSYVWPSFTATFPDGSNERGVNFFVLDKASAPCVIVPDNKNGPVSGKTFCSFDVLQDSQFAIEFSAYDPTIDNGANTCNMEPTIDLKLTNIEVVEPD